jgi:hypothetical protein
VADGLLALADLVQQTSPADDVTGARLPRLRSYANEYLFWVSLLGEGMEWVSQFLLLEIALQHSL